MAKSTKSGLGRGLNSLLGGSYEEAVPPEPAKPAPRVVIEAEELDEPIKRAFSAPVSAEAPAPPLVPQDKGVSADNFIKDEDHVTIKSVVQRRTDEVPLESISPNPDQGLSSMVRPKKSKFFRIVCICS